MKCFWLILLAVALIALKENSCVPAIRPSSQGAIIFPQDNWDDCFVDEASNRPGVCKALEECPEVFDKWANDKIYPKTCYFIKEQQFVCCPPASSTNAAPANKPDSFTKKPENKIPECDSQNKERLETIDMNGPTSASNDYPFMAVLGWKSTSDSKIWYPCGGVLISSRFVLTAAHCAELSASLSFVRLGDKNLTDSQEDVIKIKRFIVHKDYNATTPIYNDIALVELEHEVNHPRPCLWTKHDLPIGKLLALGYGHSNFDILSPNQLFKASLTAFGKTQCQDFFKFDDKLKIVNDHLCAGDMENFHNSCQGDTGGPLLMELKGTFYVVGMNSLGTGCADLPPSIYTRVSSFIDWIEPIVWPEINVRIDGKKLSVYPAFSEYNKY